MPTAAARHPDSIGPAVFCAFGCPASVHDGGGEAGPLLAGSLARSCCGVALRVRGDAADFASLLS
jgi:hypothetical protein